MSTTYNFSGGHYDYVDPSYPQYTTALNTSGSFTVPAQLQGNVQNLDITSTITAWAFSDGYYNYDSTNSTLNSFVVSTDPTGAYLIAYAASVKYNANSYILVLQSMSDPFAVRAPIADGYQTVARIFPVNFSIYPA